MAHLKSDLDSKRKSRGFEPISSFAQDRLRTFALKRGFAITRLMSDWPAIVGSDIAAFTEPVKISHAHKEMGATLTLLTAGARGPILQMQVPKIIERVNTCYGFDAIEKIKFVQTSPRSHRRRENSHGQPVAEITEEDANNAVLATQGIQNDDLREALESLGRKIFARQRQANARESTRC